MYHRRLGAVHPGWGSPATNTKVNTHRSLTRSSVWLSL